ncbi:hypothetical protein RFI_34057 [Reticulomyxa filosa]|uniref:Uncharacterized protein n=1 Tax=Reticulomyxa filosa TaxID=46433 RepID=X6LN57_RETFI|nr:hypothetical protein RFI_34057 [Reticulomyxa filosa]|eukprot:ETO03353.1 hypothetical protein RFI_34057 [Reticulomyxa filosa]
MLIDPNQPNAFTATDVGAAGTMRSPNKANFVTIKVAQICSSNKKTNMKTIVTVDAIAMEAKTQPKTTIILLNAISFVNEAIGTSWMGLQQRTRKNIRINNNSNSNNSNNNDTFGDASNDSVTNENKSPVDDQRDNANVNAIAKKEKDTSTTVSELTTRNDKLIQLRKEFLQSMFTDTTEEISMDHHES